MYLHKKFYMKSLLLFTCMFIGLLAMSQTTEKLFNGKDITGWTIHGTEKWYAQNGELICESGPDKQYGYLSTDKNYKNFILTLQFNQEANGNSGVFFHSQIPEGVKISGWQAWRPRASIQAVFMNRMEEAGLFSQNRKMKNI